MADPFYIDEVTGEIVLLDDNGQPMPGFLPQMGTQPNAWTPTDYSAGYDYATPPGWETPTPPPITPPQGPIQGPSLPQGLQGRNQAQIVLEDAQRNYTIAQSILQKIMSPDYAGE